MSTPPTLPADFFSTPATQPPQAPPEAPATLPADFFAKSASVPAPAPSAAPAASAPATLPADFFSKSAQSNSPDTLPADFFSENGQPKGTGILSRIYTGLKDLKTTDLQKAGREALIRGSLGPVSTLATLPLSGEQIESHVETTPDAGVSTGKGAWNTTKSVATLPIAGTFHRKGAGPIEGETEDWLTSQANPLNIGIAAATFGEGTFAKLLGKSGLPAAKATAYALYAKTGANLAFLTNQGYDIGANALPQAEQAYKDYRAAEGKSKDEQAQALDTFKRRTTDIVLDALSMGLATHGLATDIAEIHGASPNAEAHSHADYSNAIHEYQADNQIGSGQAAQLVREGERSVSKPARREAIANSIEAKGDNALLEKQAQTAEANPKTEERAKGYRAAQNLTPDEIALRDKLTGTLNDWKAKLQEKSLLSPDGGRDNYIPHRYVQEEVDPETGLKPKQTSAQNENAFLRPRTFNTLAEAEQADYKPASKDALKLVADYHQRANNVVARDNLAHSLLDGKTTDGAPLAVTSVQDPQFSGYEDSGLKASAPTPDNPLNRVPVYAHPDIARDLSAVLERAHSNIVLDPILKFTRQAKGSLLSLSPFHTAMETVLAGEAGVNPFGRLKDSYLTSMPKTVDYFNLTDAQRAAIRDGVAVSSTRPGSADYLSEGEGTGTGSSDLWINKIPGVGRINHFLESRVFGPNGYITGLKFDTHDKLKASIMQAQPGLTEGQAGRIAASQVNNKFGGLNYTLLGRDANTQKWMRAMLLAPDFLESRGRSVLDVAGKYGTPLAKRLIAFNVAHWLTARAANYLISGDPHPEQGFTVLSKDGTREYGVRTTMSDFLHFAEEPGGYAENRVSPAIRTVAEWYTGRDQLGLGKKVSTDQKIWDTARQLVPIPAQAATPKQSVAQPDSAEELAKSVGIQSKKVFTPAEKLAIQRASERNEEGEPLTGDELATAQRKHILQQNLADAITKGDPAVKVDALQSIHDAAKGDDAAISMKSAKEMIQAAQNYPTKLQATVHRLSLGDALDVFEVAGIQEKKLLAGEINQKATRWLKTAAQTKTAKQRAEMQPRIVKFRSLTTRDFKEPSE